MLSNSRLLRKSSRANNSVGSQPQALTKSPSSSPVKEAHEHRGRPNDPIPIPSNNPASQYTLLEKLGTGSFGVVYKAMHNETKQIVAIKQIGVCRRSRSVERGEPKDTVQTWRIPTMTFLKYSRRSQTLHNATPNT